jgi:hypothetical protein
LLAIRRNHQTGEISLDPLRWGRNRKSDAIALRRKSLHFLAIDGDRAEQRIVAARRRAASARVTTPCHRRVTCLEQNIVEDVN